MFKNAIYFLTVMVFAVSCKQAQNSNTPAESDSFILKGTIEGLKSDTLYLYQRSVLGRTIDTIFTKNNSFEYKGTFKTPTIAFIRTEDGRINQSFYVENAILEFGGDESATTVSGGKLTPDYLHFKSLRKDDNDLYKKFKDEMDALPKEAKEQRDSLERIADRHFDNILKVAMNYIEDHPDSYISLNELGTLLDYLDPYKAESYFNSLEESVRTSAGGVQLQKEINELLSTAVGAPATDFSITDINGKEITLSEITKNNYVLIDFWASWCGPCRAEIPNVKEAYNKYHDKGFEVLAISLDRNVDSWKKAVTEEQLPWLVIRDNMEDQDNMVAKLYGVRSLPTTYLIGKDGKIVARNLTGLSLHEKLAELLSGAEN